MNIGFGRLDSRGLPKQTAEFVEFLGDTGRIPPRLNLRWRGHAYLLGGETGRRVVDDGVMLIGDAAGLAYPQSGEGIRPAIESGLMAAAAIRGAAGSYKQASLESYASDLSKRFGSSLVSRLAAKSVPAGVSIALARRLLDHPWFVRHFVLDRWFLHAQQPALQPTFT
jgi:flavin-dependent dehydrogenase